MKALNSKNVGRDRFQVFAGMLLGGFGLSLLFDSINNGVDNGKNIKLANEKSELIIAESIPEESKKPKKTR